MIARYRKTATVIPLLIVGVLGAVCGGLIWKGGKEFLVPAVGIFVAGLFLAGLAFYLIIRTFGCELVARNGCPPQDGEATGDQTARSE